MLRTACYFSLDSNVFSSIKSRIVVLACSGSVGQASMSLANSGSFRQEPSSSAPHFAPPFVEIGVFEGVRGEGSIPSTSIGATYVASFCNLYSTLSTRAFHDASMMFSDTPTVPQIAFLSMDSITTRTFAAVPSRALTTRTL